MQDQTIIVARTQTAGRGRMTRSWVSKPGGLYFSVLLKPKQTAFLPNLTQLMALTVCQTIRQLGAASYLKWPNDVLVDDKKCCGILSEAITSANGFEALVLGVGVNVCQTEIDQVGQPAVSLAILGIQTSTETVLELLLTRFFAQYEMVLQKGFFAIRTDYLRCFPYVGKQVYIRHGIEPLSGTVQTISPGGELVLNTPQGQKSISIGDMYL